MKSCRLLMAAALVLLTCQAGPLWAGPCDLITQADAAKLLGEAVAAPRRAPVRGMGAGERCFYNTSAPMQKRGGVGTVTVILYDAKTMAAHGIAFKSPAKFFGRMYAVKQKRQGLTQVVSGLGDKAYWETGADTLHVLKGADYVTLKISDLGKLSAKSRKELYRKISEHRKALSVQAAKQYVLPRLGAK